MIPWQAFTQSHMFCIYSHPTSGFDSLIRHTFCIYNHPNYEKGSNS